MAQPDQMKRGIVVDGRGSQVRVLFEDNDGVISPWLDVVQSSTKGDLSYNRPKVGSQVSCAMDRNWESGTVIGAIYSDADPSPGDSENLFFRKFGDGTVLTYDEASSAFALNHASGVQLSIAGGKVKITGNVEIDGDLSVSGQTTLKGTTINGIAQSGS